MAPPLAARRLLQIDPSDNVAVATSSLAAGEQLEAGSGTVLVAEDIAFGHKIALRAIPAGGEVLKYGEVIGVATAEIAPGRHVHVHNVVSARLPGNGSAQ